MQSIKRCDDGRAQERDLGGSETDFAGRLLAWFDQHGRHDLPWQHPRTPYRVWLSEVMLQQTQVQTVIPYFEAFLTRFPDLPALAAASLDEVLAQWSGLGYYSRARNLHRAAQICVAQHRGELPDDFHQLLALPGIGRSTAGAILAQAHGARHAILDGNVRRVLSRYRRVAGDPASSTTQAALWQLSESLLPDARLADYTQALMDLGASVCSRTRPTCLLCPLQDDCGAHLTGAVAQFPQARVRRERPLRSCVQLWVQDRQQRLLLKRRSPTGIWAGLWSLPEADTQAAAIEILHGDGLRARSSSVLTSLRHEFTHYSLDIQVLAVEVEAAALTDNDTRWFATPEALALGLPQPVRRLIESQAAACAQPIPAPEVILVSRLIHCVRYGADQEGLVRIPYPGELGQRIFDQVSQRAWGEWLAHQTMLINENRLSPVDPKARAFLRDEMEKYFFGEGSVQPPGFVAP
ncbi:MAG: A/G-specific adenine glycosylase [Rhodanobacteraceae bacterium]|nr:A/G-specific adenine glycosylase [Rhodanobacteraceae bacterium]